MDLIGLRAHDEEHRNGTTSSERLGDPVEHVVDDSPSSDGADGAPR